MKIKFSDFRRACQFSRSYKTDPTYCENEAHVDPYIYNKCTKKKCPFNNKQTNSESDKLNGEKCYED